MRLPEDGVRLILVVADEIARQHGISPEEDTYSLKESAGIRAFKRLELMHDFGCKESKDIYYPELAKGVKHFKEEEGGRKVMCEAVEKWVAVRVEEERSLMTKIVAALVANKDNDTIIKELNCTLEQIVPLRTAMGK